MPKLEPHTSVPKVVRNPFILSFKNIMLGLLIGTTLISSGIAGFYYFELRFTQKDPVTPIQRPATSSAKPTPKQPTVVNETAGWKTYKNKDFSYQINTPPTWFVSDTYCKGEKRSNQVFVYDKPLSDDCGVEAVEKLGAKIAIYTGPVHDNFPNIFPDCKETQDNFEIAGLNATRYFGPEEPCTIPSFSTTKIFFNHEGNGYQIELLNKDSKGNYDPLYNKILSTFKFPD